jgi:hypothetical protein
LPDIAFSKLTLGNQATFDGIAAMVEFAHSGNFT